MPLLKTNFKIQLNLLKYWFTFLNFDMGDPVLGSEIFFNYNGASFHIACRAQAFSKNSNSSKY